MRPVLDRTAVAQGAVPLPVVVPLHPIANDSPGVVVRLEIMQPDALFFETAKEPFNNPVLLHELIQKSEPTFACRQSMFFRLCMWDKQLTCPNLNHALSERFRSPFV